MSITGFLKQYKLLFAISGIIVIVFFLLIFYSSDQGSAKETAIEGTMEISANPVFNSFNYTGNTVNANMEVGCSLPASMTIQCVSFTKNGTISVFINDQCYATGTVTGTGDIMLYSGCGCSTVCMPKQKKTSALSWKQALNLLPTFKKQKSLEKESNRTRNLEK
jgi:hypothetical protein